MKLMAAMAPPATTTTPSAINAGTFHSPPLDRFLFFDFDPPDFLPFAPLELPLFVLLRTGASCSSSISPPKSSSKSNSSSAFWKGLRTNASPHFGQGAFLPITFGFLIFN